MTDTNYGADILGQTERLAGTWEYGGEEYDLLIKDIAYSDYKLIQQYAQLAHQLDGIDDEEDADDTVETVVETAEDLDDFSWESEGNRDMVESVFDEVLIKPDVDVGEDEIGKSKATALFAGILETLQEAQDVAEAKREMPVEGNE